MIEQHKVVSCIEEPEKHTIWIKDRERKIYKFIKGRWVPLAQDTYVAGDDSIKIENNKVSVKLSEDLSNKIILKEDGLFVDKVKLPPEYVAGDNIEIKDYRISAIIPEVDLSHFQTKEDEGLETNDKTVVGAINELKENVDSAVNDISDGIDNINNQIEDINDKISEIPKEVVYGMYEDGGFESEDENYGNVSKEHQNLYIDTTNNRIYCNTISGDYKLVGEPNKILFGSIIQDDYDRNCFEDLEGNVITPENGDENTLYVWSYDGGLARSVWAWVKDTQEFVLVGQPNVPIDLSNYALKNEIPNVSNFITNSQLQTSVDDSITNNICVGYFYKSESNIKFKKYVRGEGYKDVTSYNPNQLFFAGHPYTTNSGYPEDFEEEISYSLNGSTSYIYNKGCIYIYQSHNRYQLIMSVYDIN